MEKKYHLFEVYGIELEYMIVHQETLDVYPITDQLIYKMTGEYLAEIEKAPVSWSNELALHVLEFKTAFPAPALPPLAASFQEEICLANSQLQSFGACLMPTAMHPWMNSHQELRLWPHTYNPIYETFNTIFDCRGHGWANLQSNHINLPFATEAEFAALHAAIRLVLPLIPALAASSPVADGKVSGLKDTRLEVYRRHTEKIPSITGLVVPEVCLSYQEYEDKIFKRIYADIAPHDPQKLLQFEWLNARGAITRFDRYAIEIRLVDVQECPRADLAIAYALISVVKALTEQRWQSMQELNQLDETLLHSILLETIREGENSVLTDRSYLQALGWKGAIPCSVRDLWAHLIDQCCHQSDMQPYVELLHHILETGTLATRIQKAVGSQPSKEALKLVYEQLCQCLQEGKLFLVET